MEIIYIVILFIAPGMIVKELQDYFAKEKKRKEHIYDYLFRIVFDSIVVGIISVFLFQMFCRFEIVHIVEFIELLGFLSNLTKYSIIMLAVSVLWCAVEFLLLKLFLWVKNLILDKTKSIQHTPHSTTWDAMMNEDSIKGTWQVVSIYKDDHYLMSGMIDSEISTSADEFELLLDRVDLTERVMTTHPELFKIQYEYYNATTGLRVKIYKQDILQEHWPKKIN